MSFWIAVSPCAALLIGFAAYPAYVTLATWRSRVRHDIWPNILSKKQYRYCLADDEQKMMANIVFANIHKHSRVMFISAIMTLVLPITCMMLLVGVYFQDAHNNTTKMQRQLDRIEEMQED